MTNAETEFLAELEIFRRNAEGASQYLFSFLAIHWVARRRPRIGLTLNRHPMFWGTAANALQAQALFALGRIFDQDTPHNIDQLLRKCQHRPEIFSKQSLSERKQRAKLDAPRPDWLDHYLSSAVEPTPDLRQR